MDLRTALDAHLLRLGLVAFACLAAGLVFARAEDEFKRGYAVMTAGWSSVNLVLVLASKLSGPLPAADAFRSFLILNLWLNLGYMVVGGLMVARSAKPIVKGMGWAVISQGFILLVLDGWLYRVAFP